MERLFGCETLAQLNILTDSAKRQLTGNTSGGDPDLFVYRRDNPGDRFFVEVKDHDRLTNKQHATFPFIHKICPIIVARLKDSATIEAQPKSA
jgi:hypothetical protein